MSYQAILKLHDASSRLRSAAGLSELDIEAMERVSLVFPFKTNAFVVNELIDWNAVPDDPIFQLTFPQPGMLSTLEHSALIDSGCSADTVSRIRAEHNPHPAGQLELNIPEGVEGLQHKYSETVLVFPSRGQTCHAYCSFCFRWPQFVGDQSLRIALDDPSKLTRYLLFHPEVTDVLVTGGDPMVLRATVLEGYLQAALSVPSVQTIRVATKSLAYWPHRFIHDRDSDQLIRALSTVVESGRHLALMAHVSHPRELESPETREAIGRLHNIGAVLRAQAPLIRHVNDDARNWSEMWKREVGLGIVPYYMFVERDTGPHDYFAVPLDRCLSIYNDAMRNVTGLARTARGPVMSTTAGKIIIEGKLGDNFVLRMLQSRNADLVGTIFLAWQKSDISTWIDDLEPVEGKWPWP